MSSLAALDRISSKLHRLHRNLPLGVALNHGDKSSARRLPDPGSPVDHEGDYSAQEVACIVEVEVRL